MSFNCGSAVDDACVGTTFQIDGYVNSNNVAVPIETRCNTLVSEVVSVGTFMITNIAAASASSMTENQIKGVNALRCAFLNGFVNIYQLLAAAFYAARQFGQQAKLQEYVNEGYPYICTCKRDVEALAPYFGGGDTSKFASCAEE